VYHLAEYGVLTRKSSTEEAMRIRIGLLGLVLWIAGSPVIAQNLSP